MIGEESKELIIPSVLCGRSNRRSMLSGSNKGLDAEISLKSILKIILRSEEILLYDKLCSV